MDFQRILVRATNWVGDAVMSLPALQALRVRFPHSHIAILARPWVADLYEREPFCDEVIPYVSSPGWHGLVQKWQKARSLRGRFDCALLLQNAFEAAAVAWVAQIPERIGYNRDNRRFLLTKPIPLPKPGEIPVHQRFYYMELLRRAGLINSYDANVRVSLTGADIARRAGLTLLDQRGLTGRFIGLSPGAAFGGAKRWLPERFAESAITLCRTLDATAIIFGSAGERALGDIVALRIEAQGLPVVNLAGKTSLREFIDMTAATDLFLTNDSGSMHIASALGVPTVTVFGPTDENATGPAGSRYRILRQPVECSPCHLRECPIDHRCMTRVESAQVIDAALEILQ